MLIKINPQIVEISIKKPTKLDKTL